MFKLQVSTIKREAKPGQRRTATAAAAYRSGSLITDARTGNQYDYTKRKGIEYTELIMPPGVKTPEREKLWNDAEAAETRKNSVVAREVMVALPAELDAKARVQLVLAFACHIAAIHKCAVDVAIHAPARGSDERNYHAHLLCTTRRIEKDGTFGKKTRELDDRKSGAVEALRERWADLANEELERSGSRTRIDHRSYARQGILRVPGVHLGHQDAEKERHGIRTERGDLNRAASIINEALEDIRIDPDDQPTPSVLDIYTAAVAAAEARARDQAAGRMMEKEIEHTTAAPEPEPEEPEPAEEEPEEEWDADLEEEKKRFAAEQKEKKKARERAAQEERRKALAVWAKTPTAAPAEEQPQPPPVAQPTAPKNPTAPGADYYAKKAARKAAAAQEAAQAAAAAAAEAEREKERKNEKMHNAAIGLKGRRPPETQLERREREHRAAMEQAGVYIKKPARNAGQEHIR